MNNEQIERDTRVAAEDALAVWLMSKGWTSQAARNAAEQITENARKLGPQDFGF